MNISEAISLVNTLKPNQYSDSQKIAWLSQLDGKIFLELIKTHMGGIDAFHGYTADVDLETELLVEFPFSQEIYNYYLQSMIDRENGEVSKYNQSAAMFNEAYQAYVGWYNRNHVPLPNASAFLF
jgi:hypothetical protein